MPGNERSIADHVVLRAIYGLAAVLLAAVLLSMLLSWLVETQQKRTVFVSASTSRLAMTLLEGQAPLSLGGALLCLPRAVPRRPSDHETVMTCNEGGWKAVAPGTDLPDASEIDGAGWPEDTDWPAAVVFDPPQGTKVELEGPLTGLVNGARLIMPTEDFAARGRYLARAELELGTPPAISQRGYVHSGKIAFRARATLTYSFGNPPNILLREDQIPVGGYVRFVDMKTKRPSAMNVQLIADAKDRRFDVQAVNAPGPTVAIMQYVGTEPLRLVPMWTDLIVEDPFISLLSVLGGLTSLGAVLRIRSRREDQPASSGQ